MIPSAAPGSVTPRKKRMISTTYGKVAVKYTTYPALCIPLISQSPTITHAPNSAPRIFPSIDPLSSIDLDRR